MSDLFARNKQQLITIYELRLIEDMKCESIFINNPQVLACLSLSHAFLRYLKIKLRSKPQPTYKGYWLQGRKSSESDMGSNPEAMFLVLFLISPIF
jgi:hypothetical protein